MAFVFMFGDGSLRALQARVDKFWDVDFLDATDAKTRRKFDKQLADLWANLREQGLLGTSVREEADRKCGRADVEYDTWYSAWMKQLAKNYTRAELEDQLYGAKREVKRAAGVHLRAIDRTSSMWGRSQARAQGRNVVAAVGDFKIALTGALEIHDLFPEHAKQ